MCEACVKLSHSCIFGGISATCDACGGRGCLTTLHLRCGAATWGYSLLGLQTSWRPPTGCLNGADVCENLRFFFHKKRLDVIFFFQQDVEGYSHHWSAIICANRFWQDECNNHIDHTGMDFVFTYYASTYIAYNIYVYIISNHIISHSFITKPSGLNFHFLPTEMANYLRFLCCADKRCAAFAFTQMGGRCWPTKGCHKYNPSDQQGPTLTLTFCWLCSQESC